MRNVRNAGKRPAASRPASQAQTLRCIAACPFCAWQDRKIHVDTTAMMEASARHPNGLHILLHEHPDQRLFVFGDDATAKPCPHLALMFGACELWNSDGYNGESPLCVEFDLDHRVVVAQPNCYLEVYLKERVIGHACGRRFMPTTPVCCRKINKRWHEAASEMTPPTDFHLTASVYFAVDPLRLFEELAVQHAAYQQHRSMEEVACKQ